MLATLLGALSLFHVTPAQAQQTADPVTNLSAASGDGQLEVTWTNPSGAGAGITDISMRWREQGTSAWTLPANTLSGSTTSFEITGLTNDSTYDVEVRLYWAIGNIGTYSSWASTTGTPLAPPTVSLSASPNPVLEGSSVIVTARLSRALSNSVSVPVTLTAGTAESGDYGALTSISIAAGATEGTGMIATNQDTDEDDETFTVALGSLTSTSPSVTEGTPSSVTITIWDDEKSHRLSVEASPPCGTTVTDMSVAASTVLLLTPPPAAETKTEYRWVTETSAGAWRGALPIRSVSEEFNPGRGTRSPHSTFAQLRNNFPGFKGFEFRLTNDLGTASCTWQFDDGGGEMSKDTTPSTPDPDTTTNQPPSNTGGTGGGGGGGGPALSGDASLSALGISGISPDFDTDTETYTVSAYDRDSVTVTPTASDDGAEITVTVNGETVEKEGTSYPVTLDEDGETSIEIEVTAEDGTVKIYTLTVMSCPGEERKILEMFYDSTQGDMWEESSGWNIEDDLGNWHGVKTRDGRVAVLSLPDNNLSGDIPSALLCFEELSGLSELALWDNDGLSGDIPDEFALAVERAVLRDVAAALSLNPVWFDTYEDPYEFGDWHEGVTTDDDGRVTELDFTGEGIEGEIPESVFELENLRVIETGCRVTLEAPTPGRVSVTMAEEGCSDAFLSNIEISPGELAFSPMDLFYETAVGYGPENITVTPETNHPRASLTINGEDAVSGEGMEITLNEEEPTVVSIEVTARDGRTTQTYEITVTRCGAEREDLARFYEKTGGADWSDNENWNSEEPPGQWFGVRTDEDGSVISLRLPDNGLSGETPRELLCLSELKELALWDNDGLSGEIPEELTLAVERAVLRDIAAALSLNPVWFDTYEDHPYEFENWHEGVTTDDDGRVTELDFTGEGIEGEIPESVFELENLRAIETGCEVTLEATAPGRVSVTMAEGCEGEPASSGDGGCALTPEDDSSAFSLFLLALLVFAARGRTRARG